jgi:hypothetical protein
MCNLSGIGLDLLWFMEIKTTSIVTGGFVK